MKVTNNKSKTALRAVISAVLYHVGCTAFQGKKKTMRPSSHIVCQVGIQKTLHAGYSIASCSDGKHHTDCNKNRNSLG
jgi:hypothetical protein